MHDVRVEVGMDAAVDQGLAENRARRPLVWVLVFASIATTSGTFIYAYPNTLEPFRRGMIVVHDVSGDLMIAAGVVYLVFHLKRTWRMWKRVTSRWSGITAVAVWTIAAATGVQGQVGELEPGSLAWRAHIVASIALIVIGGFHAAVGLRRRLKSERR